MVRLWLLGIMSLVSATAFAHKERWDENREGWSDLMNYIYWHRTNKFLELIQSGVDVNYRSSSEGSNWRLTAVEVAIRLNNEVALTALLRTGRVKNIQSFLIVASMEKSAVNLNLLLDYGASTRDTTFYGNHSLNSAASFGSVEVVETLLIRGADVNFQREVDGITPLMLAAFNGSSEKVKLLLDYGADRLAKDKNGNSVYHYIDAIWPRMNVSRRKKEQLRELIRCHF